VHVIAPQTAIGSSMGNIADTLRHPRSDAYSAWSGSTE